jgi:phospholipid/cholesterol/gamma-HCH transport system substrate-binding protein
VGSVRDIRIDKANVERVRVLIEVSNETPIKRDTVAELALQGVTGIAFVQLTGGTQAAPPLQPSEPDELAVIESRRSTLQEVVNRLPQVIQKALIVADQLMQLLDKKNIRAVSTTLESLRHASEMLGSDQGQLSLFLRDSREAIGTLQGAVADLQKLTAQLNTRVGPLADSAETTIADARATLVELRAAAARVEQFAGKLNTIVAEGEGPIRDFARSGLYELSLFLTEARVLVDALTRLTTRIERDPAQFFFGDSQNGVKAQ